MIFSNVSFSKNFVFVIILFISIFSSSYILFRFPFEFYLHYLLVIPLLPFLVVKNGIPKFYIIIFTYLGLVGIINVISHNNLLFTFIKVYGGLLVISYFFYGLISKYNFNLKLIFYWYCKLCYFLSFIGIIQIISYLLNFKLGYDYSFLFNKWRVIDGGLIGIRVNSILAEPSQFGIVIAPATYISIKNLISKKDIIFNKYQSIIIILNVIFTASTIAYAGLLICILLCTKTFRLRYLGFGLIISLMLYFIAYNYVNEFKLRVDAAKGLWIDNDFGIKNTNNSSFVLYNNLSIAFESLSKHPFFGTGLGSHETAFKKFSLTKTMLNYNFEFNIKDGNSLFIRLCTETGLIGLFFVVYLLKYGFIYITKSSNNEDNIHESISHSLFVILILTLLRQGNYMLNGLPLIFFLYYYNGKNYKSINE